MLEGAASLSAVLGSALLTAEFLRTNEVRGTATAIETDVRTAPALISRVRLLFGPKSKPADSAVLAHIRVENLLTVIKELASLEEAIAAEESSASDRARAAAREAEQRFFQALEEARRYVREFNEATSEALWTLTEGSTTNSTASSPPHA